MARIQYTPDDHIAAQRLHGRPTRFGWTVAIVAALAVIIGLAVTDPQYRLVSWAVLWVPAAMLFGMWLLWGLYIPLKARRNFARYPLAQIDYDFALLPEGIRTDSPRGSNMLLWQDIDGWRIDSRTLLVYLSPRLFLNFPLRLAQQGFPIDELKAALAREIGPPIR